MPTNNPKVSAYIPQPVFDRFKAFYEEKGISMSQAVAVIFSEYFQIDLPVDHKASNSGLLVDRFQRLEHEFAQFKELADQKFQDLMEMFGELLVDRNGKSQVKLLETDNVIQVVDCSLDSEPLNFTELHLELPHVKSSSLPIIPPNEPPLINLLPKEQDVGIEPSVNVKVNSFLQGEPPLGILSELDYGLTIDQLSKRIGSTKASFSVQKSKSKSTKQFGDWVQHRDPNKIRWLESDRRGRIVYYKPDSSTPQELLDSLLLWKQQNLSSE